MNFWDKCHFLHRAWRYRLVSEKFGVGYLLNLDLNGRFCVDIGANRGIFSYWMHKKIGPTGKVFAFEPQRELNIKLKQLKTTFGLKQLEIAEIGLSSKHQTLKMSRPINHWGGASVETPGSAGDHEEFDIELSTLDSYFDNDSCRRIGFIKCDVEGHEFDVLKGAINSIKKGTPKILIECHDAFSENCKTFELLESLNYSGFFFHEGGLCSINDYSSHKEAGLVHRKAMTDFVFLPNESSI